MSCSTSSRVIKTTVCDYRVSLLPACADEPHTAPLSLPLRPPTHGSLACLNILERPELCLTLVLSFWHLAVIYIKNRVNRSWERSEQYAEETPIPEDEKARFRERLLPVMASSQGPVRQQIIPVLQKILHYDFPNKWPNFMDYTMQLLNTNDPSSVLAGLQCLLAICRAWRFRTNEENRAHYDKVIELSFPRLLAICNELVNQESFEAGEMLHLALKCYKHATWVCDMTAACCFSSPLLVSEPN